jgi:hypothetical protein
VWAVDREGASGNVAPPSIFARHVITAWMRSEKYCRAMNSSLKTVFVGPGYKRVDALPVKEFCYLRTLLTDSRRVVFIGG